MKSGCSLKIVALLAASLVLIMLFFALTVTVFPRNIPPAPMTGRTSGGFSRSAVPTQLDDYSFEGLYELLPLIAPEINVTRIPYEKSKSTVFRQFAGLVMNGNSEQVRGIFVEGLMALPVVQQPAGEITYVAGQMDVVTQFQSAADHNVIGLLAHNYLSGSLFYQLTTGEEVRIVFGDGSYQRYRIIGSYAFQKLEPSNLQSDLVDMSTEEVLTTNQVFNRFYNGEHHVTFQTCLEEGGLSNWGLTFVVAEPIFSETR